MRRIVRPLAVAVGDYCDVAHGDAGQQAVEKAAPNALAITRETLAPLDARERETLMALLEKIR